MITVVIPNYNGIEYLPKCLASITGQTFTDYGIVVVDDCSSDGGIDVCRELYPEVKYLCREKNGGFSAAVNDGIRYGISCGAEYVILLNNDTQVESDFIEQLYRAASTGKKCFSVQAKMISDSNRDVMDDAGNFYMLPGWAYARGKGKPVGNYCKAGKIFSACAGAAIYRTDVLKKIGLFDEMHFAYLEDIDIGYRAGIFGYYNYYEPKAVVYHLGSATSGSRYNEFKTRLAARNSIYIVYKNQTVLQWILHFPFLLAGFVIKQLYFMKKGYGKIYHDSILEGLKMSFSPEGRKHKVAFRWKNLLHYIRMEWELWRNVVRRVFAD